MKNTKASMGAVLTQVEVIRKKTFEKLFEKMRHAKVMEVDVQKNENDFFGNTSKNQSLHRKKEMIGIL